MMTKKRTKKTNNRCITKETRAALVRSGEPTSPTVRYHLLIDCESESEQQKLYERLTQQNFKCRVLTL